MERTQYRFNDWMSQWPPVSLKKNYTAEQSDIVALHGGQMMLYLKDQGKLGGINSNRVERHLADGTVIIARTSFGNDVITVYTPVKKEEEVVLEEGKWYDLYLVNTVTDHKLFYVNFITGKSKENKDPKKFWRNQDFYQGPWEADMSSVSGGFGSSTAAALNNFKKSSLPLVLNTATYPKWNYVIDNNWNLAGLAYFPTLVFMNVPGTGPHAGLDNENCYDYPLCLSAIIPPNSCVFCFAYWPFHCIMPLDDRSLSIVPEINVSFLRDKDKPTEYVEILKKSQVWSRGATTGTPRVDITGKNNYNIQVAAQSGLLYSTRYRESIYPDSSRGKNSRSGNWWNTWNEVLHIYQPCWVDIQRGFGGDESGFYPFNNWYHETPSTGIAAYDAYANYIWGGNTRQARGYVLHWMENNPDDPESVDTENSLILSALDEKLSFDDTSCTHGQTTDNQPLGGCSFNWGAFDTANAIGSMSGKFNVPVATLGNKRFIYFENIFTGTVTQSASRHSGGTVTNNLGVPECQYIGPCCTSIGWYCFGLCGEGGSVGCAGHPTMIQTGFSTINHHGTQYHSFNLAQSLRIGKVPEGGDGSALENIEIATGLFAFNHNFEGSDNYVSGISIYGHWPSGAACDNIISHCDCNYGPLNSPEDYYTCSDVESYSRDYTTYEIIDYASNPTNDDVVIAFKKIVLHHTCQTSGCSETNWSHAGTRTVTWHLYININRYSTAEKGMKNYSKTIDLTPEFIATCSGLYRVGVSSIHNGSGDRAWGISVQLNNDFLAYSFLSEKFEKMGENFGNILGQNMYPGPMNLEDRQVEPFYGWEGEVIWTNVGCDWTPKKQYYGMVKLNSAFKKREWSYDIDGETEIVDGVEVPVVTDISKKVRTVGLLKHTTGEPQ